MSSTSDTDTSGASPSVDVPTGTVGLNHAVLWVADPARSSAFYQRTLGFVELAAMGGAVFLKAPGSPNDHDLGLFGTDRPPTEARSRGLYHLAWEVATLRALREARARLIEEGALVGESDHAFTKSLYALDPDGIEFEVMWQIPMTADDRSKEHHLPTRPLNLDAEIERYGLDTLGGWREVVAGAAHDG